MLTGGYRDRIPFCVFCPALDQLRSYFFKSISSTDDNFVSLSDTDKFSYILSFMFFFAIFIINHTSPQAGLLLFICVSHNIRIYTKRFAILCGENLQIGCIIIFVILSWNTFSCKCAALRGTFFAHLLWMSFANQGREAKTAKTIGNYERNFSLQYGNT